MTKTNVLKAKGQEALLKTLQIRFEKNMHRHKSLKWQDVENRLLSNPIKLWSLQQMEDTGGEPDVVAYDKKSGEYSFFDCAPESPKGRRSICYDRQGLESRKEHRPKNTAIDMASAMGIDLLNEEQYMQLQELETVDSKTSSWLLTPEGLRTQGGSIFGDFRFGRVFVYHNGAQSYYGGRGFRGALFI